MESKTGLKAPEELYIIGSLLHFFLKFRNKDLVCRCHTLTSSGFICARNASIRAPTQNIPVRSPVALNGTPGFRLTLTLLQATAHYAVSCVCGLLSTVLLWGHAPTPYAVREKQAPRKVIWEGREWSKKHDLRCFEISISIENQESGERGETRSGYPEIWNIAIRNRQFDLDVQHRPHVKLCPKRDLASQGMPGAATENPSVITAVTLVTVDFAS